MGSKVSSFESEITRCPKLVAAFEELSKEEPDADFICAAVQQALLFLGNASTHLSHVHRMKIFKPLNRDVQGLAKDTDFSKLLPTSSEKGLSKR